MPKLRPFERALFKALTIHMLPKISGNPQALTEVLANDLFEGEGPRRIETKYTRLEFDLWRTYQAYREVERSIDTLSDIAVYLRASPFPEDVIPASRYLQFHAEAFVTEVYILRERMEVLLKIVKRQLKRLRSPSIQTEQIDELSKRVHASLEPVVELRRRHTHETRLSEAAIERLDTIALLATFPEQGVQRIAMKVRAQATRKAFSKLRIQVRAQIRSAKKLRRELEFALRKAIFFRHSPYLRPAEG